MRLIIEMPDEAYASMVDGTFGEKYYPHELFTMVAKGIPLPKGCGRLIDAEKLAKEINRAWTLWEKKGEDCYLFSDVITPMLVCQQTIIEANKEVNRNEIFSDNTNA